MRRTVAARRVRTTVVVAAVVGAVLAGAARAQEFPNRPVRVVAGMPAGGGADLNARRLSERLARLLGQNVVVQNVPGGAGTSAAVTVMGSTPDGHTLFFASHPILAVNPVLYPKLQYNADRDFAPVALVSQTPHVLLANAGIGAASVAELIALAKARPASLHYGSGGTGTSIHLAGELLESMAGIDLAHVPYRGAAPAVTALVGNEIQLLFDSSMTAIGHVRGGRVKGLAIASSARTPALPDVPTFAESGLPGFEAGVGHGVLVAASVPAATVNALNRAINTALAEPEYRRQMTELGVTLVGGTPEQFRAFLLAERRKWGEIIRRQGIKVN
jgi:tripartite-type tricarboxylate transporter receptor subunit TctC